MTVTQQIITVAVVVFATMLTRYIPFVVFPAGKPTPKYISYLGTVLPSAIFGLLVVYCLKDVEHILGKPRVTRTHCNSRRCRSSSAEKANAAFHSGRNSMLYAARSIRF